MITDYVKYVEDMDSAYMQREQDNREYTEIKKRAALQREINKCKADFPKTEPEPQAKRKTKKKTEECMVFDGKLITMAEMKAKMKAMWERIKAEGPKKAPQGPEHKPENGPTHSPKTAAERTREPVKKEPEPIRKPPEPVKVPKKEKDKEKEVPVIEVPNRTAEKKVEKIEADMILTPAREMLKELQNMREPVAEKPKSIKIMSRATMLKNQMAYRDGFEEELFGSKTQEKTAKKSLVLHRRPSRGHGGISGGR